MARTEGIWGLGFRVLGFQGFGYQIRLERDPFKLNTFLCSAFLKISNTEPFQGSGLGARV